MADALPAGTASFGASPFGVVSHLKAQLAAKRKVLEGQQSESGRIARAMVETAGQIEEIEGALSILEAAGGARH